MEWITGKNMADPIFSTQSIDVAKTLGSLLYHHKRFALLILVTGGLAADRVVCGWVNAELQLILGLCLQLLCHWQAAPSYITARAFS